MEEKEALGQLEWRQQEEEPSICLWYHMAAATTVASSVPAADQSQFPGDCVHQTQQDHTCSPKLIFPV